MNRDIVIICESMYHGNTQKLAAAMARKLNCRIITGDQALSEDLQQYKIIGLGSGIYFTSHHPKLFGIVARMNQTQKAFLFSTHGRPYLGKYHASLKLALSKRDIPVIGEFSCPGFDCTGPYLIVGGGNKGKPDEGDQQRAAKFIARVLPEYSKNTDIVHNGKNIEVRYDECIGCGKCEIVCPMKVFDFESNKPIVVNEADCTHCSLCIENCPSQAVSIHHSWKEAIAIAKRHAKRTSL